jgi:hypothetical protein
MNITTIEELQKHIGEFLAFEVNYGHTSTVWIQKLQKIGDKYAAEIPKGQTDIYHLHCYSILSAEIYPNVKAYSGKYGDTKDVYALYHTNAQNVIRTPTKDEMKKYRDFWRKYKVLGHF